MKVTQTNTKPEFDIHLTNQEAFYLCGILGAISGNNKEIKGFVDNLWNELQAHWTFTERQSFYNNIIQQEMKVNP